jgi:hypothetical protein
MIQLFLQIKHPFRIINTLFLFPVTLFILMKIPKFVLSIWIPIQKYPVFYFFIFLAAFIGYFLMEEILEKVFRIPIMYYRNWAIPGYVFFIMCWVFADNFLKPLCKRYFDSFRYLFRGYW